MRERKANSFRFKDDGIVPNHPKWPLILYRGAVVLPDAFDPSAVFEELFAGNDWGQSWRNGIYDFIHYHSQIHEVLGIARGEAQVQFGGLNGRKLMVEGGRCGNPAGRHRSPASGSQRRFAGGRRLSAIRHLRSMPDERGS